MICSFKFFFLKKKQKLTIIYIDFGVWVASTYIEFPEVSLSYLLLVKEPLSSSPTSFTDFRNSNKTQIQIPFFLLNPKHPPLNPSEKWVIEKIRKRRRNVAAVLHSGFLHSSSDPLCATNQKLESVCGNNGICSQRIKKLQEQGLSSPTTSLVKDVGFHALQQQHQVDFSDFMNWKRKSCCRYIFLFFSFSWTLFVVLDCFFLFNIDSQSAINLVRCFEFVLQHFWLYHGLLL